MSCVSPSGGFPRGARAQHGALTVTARAARQIDSCWFNASSRPSRLTTPRESAPQERAVRPASCNQAEEKRPTFREPSRFSSRNAPCCRWPSSDQRRPSHRHGDRPLAGTNHRDTAPALVPARLLLFGPRTFNRPADGDIRPLCATVSGPERWKPPSWITPTEARDWRASGAGAVGAANRMRSWRDGHVGLLSRVVNLQKLKGRGTVVWT